MSFSSCKKYEEDDSLLTFRTPLKRIAGKHEITEFTFNESDSTSYIKNKFGSIYVLFLDNKNDQGDYYLNVYSKDNNDLIASGTWNFLDNNNQVNFEFKGDTNTIYSSGDLTIKKLTYKEIRLENANGFLNKLDTSLTQTAGYIRLKLVRM